jgi:hypothetical protein
MDAYDGPVVIGYDGGPGGADALALGLGWTRQLNLPSVVVTVYPGPAQSALAASTWSGSRTGGKRPSGSWKRLEQPRRLRRRLTSKPLARVQPPRTA